MEQRKIRVAIAGYGNLGKGIENNLYINPDMELVCIFTRRNPEKLNIKSKVPVVNEKDIVLWKDKIDIVFLCGGSANDLPTQGPKYASLFNTVDSLDTHAKALEHIKKMDEVSAKNGTIAMSCVGWDPGLFSNMRLLINSVLPNAQTYTFWGSGVSQGHSDAIRKIDGVKDARQYTVPIKDALEQIRKGKAPQLTKRQMHKRICYVVAKEEENKDKIEQEIKNMPYYFDEYDTTVNFVTHEELLKNHSMIPHGGSVISVGETSLGEKQVVEFTLSLASNPEFTASILIAYGRAAYRMWQEGQRGSRNFSDVAPKYLTRMNYLDIITQML